MNSIKQWYKLERERASITFNIDSREAHASKYASDMQTYTQKRQARQTIIDILVIATVYGIALAPFVGLAFSLAK